MMKSLAWAERAVNKRARGKRRLGFIFFVAERKKSHCTGSGVKVSQRPSERIKVLSDGLC